MNTHSNPCTHKYTHTYKQCTHTHIHTHTDTHTHTHTHTHTCKCHQTWTLKIIWNYNAKMRTRVCEIALANRGHPSRVCDISLANRGLTPATLLFWVFTRVSTCICIRLHHFSNRGQSTVAVLSSIWFWCIGSCPRLQVKTHAHTHTHTHTHTTQHIPHITQHIPCTHHWHVAYTYIYTNIRI